ncbi:MAG: hypothetical protein JO013_13390 [Alphaproteobacteria bacterium]|nr:hypothetical protein [Alphaproteobacteria bacterium]
MRPNLDDVRFADVVVVGRVANYRIIRDQAFRDRMLASPKLPADMRKFYQDPRGKLLPDYARFDVRVDEVLAGRAGRTLSVTWDNSTFSEPDTMPAGPYLIALRRPGSPVPPLRGPSGTIFPAPDKHALALLQAPCSIPFLYEVASDQARAIRGLIKSRRAR